MGTEDGFSLLESTLAIGLIALGVGGLLEALITASHQRATPELEAQLLASARNVIVDFSAATAYEPISVAQSFSLGTGTSIAMPQPAATGTPIAISCTPSIAQAILTVVCTDHAGHSAQMQAFVGQRAPAPGSTVLFSPPPTP
jgi:type II secretory pathway pseudopilin PulG